MFERDRYQRQTPVSRPSTGRLDPSVLPERTERDLQGAKAALSENAPQFDLLIQACQAGSVALPEGPAVPAPVPLTPQTEVVLRHLTEALMARPGLAGQVAAAVKRYLEAIARLAELEAGSPDPQALAALQREIFQLMMVLKVFRGDPILSQVFPAPPSLHDLAAPKPTPQPAVAAPAPFEKARQLAKDLAPKLEVIRLALAQLDRRPGGTGVLFSPAVRNARLLAMRLQGDAALQAELREADRLFAALESALASESVEAIKTTVFPLGRLAMAWSRHPLLKDVLLETPEALS